MAAVRASYVCGVAVIAALLGSPGLAFVEDLDDTFKDTRVNDVWLVDFYAPWCGYCKKLEPIWNDVGLELKSSGSPVRVGKMDATAYSGMASEFGVRGYPTIKLLKGDLAYNYKGPRTKDDIVEFANRVSGPAVRALPSKHMFEHMIKRHDVLFVYVGGESPLKEKYSDVASELIVYTYFFSASEEVVSESVSLAELPAVVVFKDGSYFTYDGEYVSDVLCCSLSLRVWLDLQFGHMDGNDYINSLIMGEVAVPSVVILNTSNEQYFLPSEPIHSMEQLVQFISSVLNGSAQAYGGDGIIQRIKRVAFDARSTIMVIFRSSPLLGCFLFGLPLGVISLMCYGICTAETDDGTEDMDGLKREGLTDEEDEEEEDDRRRAAELDDMDDGENEEEDAREKDPEEKKTD
uniref:protein disulfide-isomerase n=1 Tax=Gouania willdenowi TaxID=441366 RepID=A0A8C5NFT2_GOUWI